MSPSWQSSKTNYEMFYDSLYSSLELLLCDNLTLYLRRQRERDLIFCASEIKGKMAAWHIAACVARLPFHLPHRENQRACRVPPQWARCLIRRPFKSLYSALTTLPTTSNWGCRQRTPGTTITMAAPCIAQVATQRLCQIRGKTGVCLQGHLFNIPLHSSER